MVIVEFQAMTSVINQAV